MWRAIRYGLDGKLLDIESERKEELAAAEAVERLCRWAEVDVELPRLNGAQRQRRLIDSGATPAEVYAETVRETNETPQEVP
jgi:carboxylate-amine ligase